MSSFNEEVTSGDRFEFGKNWQSFLSNINDQRINEAQKSLINLFGISDLRGKTFLDIGCGSGLFSLAARKLGAIVLSFDFDPYSASCASYLRKTYDNNSDDWKIETGSILDSEFLHRIGKFDIVYAWGVLHHTGNMWEAINNFSQLVVPDGLACLAIYEDQGITSTFWKKIKQIYCSGKLGKSIVCTIFFPYFSFRFILSSIIRRKNVFAEYKKNRGMSVIHDWCDWLGGYPFEVAKVEEIFVFFRDRGYSLTNIRTTNTLNEFVFKNNNHSNQNGRCLRENLKTNSC